MNYYTSTTNYNCGIHNPCGYFLKRVAPYRDALTVVSECTFNWYWLAAAARLMRRLRARPVPPTGTDLNATEPAWLFGLPAVAASSQA